MLVHSVYVLLRKEDSEGAPKRHRQKVRPTAMWQIEKKKKKANDYRGTKAREGGGLRFTFLYPHVCLRPVYVCVLAPILVADTFLFDCDGVLWRGAEQISGSGIASLD